MLILIQIKHVSEAGLDADNRATHGSSFGETFIGVFLYMAILLDSSDTVLMDNSRSSAMFEASLPVSSWIF